MKLLSRDADLAAKMTIPLAPNVPSQAEGITVGLLGPTVVAWDGHQVELSSMGAVLVLILAVAPGRAVTSDDLQRKAWPERDPDGKTAACLRSAVLALRARFASAAPQARRRAACPPSRVVVAGSPGYHLPAVQTDADLFLDLAGLPRLSLRQEDPWTAWCRAGDALALWRGRPLADAGSRAFAIEPALRLEEARLTVETARCEAALMLGLHREILPDLERLAVAWPDDFGVTCLFVTALARCGRAGQAAEVCYQALSHAHALGLDDTAHRRLQYDALSGSIPATGRHWQPPGPGRLVG